MVEIIILLVLLATGFVFGRLAETRHYRSIRARESLHRELVVVPVRTPPRSLLRHRSELVRGNVVVSVDYFKATLAALRNLVGGRVAAYETLLDRARREAILRMQEQATRLGAEAVFNLKVETSRISGRSGSGVGSIEVLAYGTALIPGSVGGR